jgi:hypothetical protein
MSHDFSKSVNMIELSNLNFELSKEEDEIFQTKSKIELFKILKVVMYYIGLIDKKNKYMQDQVDKQIEVNQQE